MESSKSNTFPSLEELKFKRKNLPLKPGVYLFKDIEGNIIYIGKAKFLQKRVNSYWKTRSKSEDPIYSKKTERLVKNIRDLDIFIVENEMEALLLENELIKKHQPIFNVLLKDDKSYPWVLITKEKFPRIRIVRSPERFGFHNRYLGPFVESGDLKRTLIYIRKIFPFCTCKKKTTRNKRTRPCIYYQIKLCPGPCMGYIDEKEYNDNIQNIEYLLLGEIAPIQKLMKENMMKLSQDQKYEEALIWRDRLEDLNQFTIEQSIFNYNFEESKGILDEKPNQGLKNNEIENDEESKKKNLENLKKIDIIAGHYSERRAGIVIIHVRSGRVLGKTPYIIDIQEKYTAEAEFRKSIIKQHYLKENIPLPDEIVLEYPLPKGTEQGLLEYLNNSDKRQITFIRPSESNKTAGLVRIAKKNIQLLIKQKDEYEKHIEFQDDIKTDQENKKKGLENLRDLLHLSNVPEIIEGFDMAHLLGFDYTGSLVCFKDGIPEKKRYRRYKIKTVDRPDDVAAMKEVMQRRYIRAINENDLPDLVVVDGGKAQLNMAHKLFIELGIEDIPHIGLAKPEGRSEIYKAPQIIIPESKDKIKLDLDSPALHILQHLRNESHRFANEYHQKLKNKRQRKSELDDIPGIGPERKKKLLRHFKSVKEIKNQSLEELSKVIGSSLGKKIFDHFKEKSKIIKKISTEKKRIVLKKKKKKLI